MRSWPCTLCFQRQRLKIACAALALVGRLWIGQNGTRLEYVTQAARSACGLSDLIKVRPFPAAICSREHGIESDPTVLC